jgi:hypothetical protein
MPDDIRAWITHIQRVDKEMAIHKLILPTSKQCINFSTNNHLLYII